MTKTANWNETKWDERTCRRRTKTKPTSACSCCDSNQKNAIDIHIDFMHVWNWKKNMVWVCSSDWILRAICDVTRWRGKMAKRLKNTLWSKWKFNLKEMTKPVSNTLLSMEHYFEARTRTQCRYQWMRFNANRANIQSIIKR